MKNNSMRRSILKGILILTSGILLVSCQSSGRSESTKDSITNADSNPVPVTYSYQNNGDTIVLQLTNLEGKVTGELAYQIKEKDRNTGSIEGVLTDSLLLADYTFQSEGTTSVRQVAFKFKGDTVIEGYGDIEERDGKMVFKEPEKLHFIAEMPLVKK
ncbi:hypothetical protein HMPREF0766_13229 [Sphingobacterium spiritivorum ATCC 33861]|uniref:Tat pathway signal sequence domain protein n=2 Tax=Sphingobacterium spiritivorum TaxID=258 RepID=D7VQH5_SPHSI|nr:hypothetical protein HMPREF0766_13229 [Sphingobacterium spiritivorum ATCC 33861]